MTHRGQTYANWSTVVVKRSSDHRRYYHPQSNTRPERRPSPNKNLPQMYDFSKTALTKQTTPVSRAGKATRGFPNGYRAIRGIAVVTAVQGYTLKSAYHNVVVGEERRRCPEKRGSSRLQIARHSAGLPSSSLRSASRSIAFPNNRSPLTSDPLEPPSTVCPSFVPPVASSRFRRHDVFLAQHIQSRPSFKEPANLPLYVWRKYRISSIPLSAFEKRCSLIQPLQHA